MTTPRAVRLCPSDLEAVAALVVALGATSYAAGLAANSVGTVQLRNGAVSTAKIKGGAVTGGTVRNGTIGRPDLAPGVVPAPPRSVRRRLPATAPGGA